MVCECCQHNEFELAFNNSFLNSPVYKCKFCGLFVNKFEDTEKIQAQLTTYYKSEYWKSFRRDQNASLPLKLLKQLIKKIPTLRFACQRAYSQINYINMEPMTVAELGPGRGDASFEMIKQGWKVTCIEADENNSNLIKLIHKKIQVINQNFENFSSGIQYDLIFASHSVEHCMNINNVLRNCHASLKTGGRLFVEVPNAENSEALNQSVFDDPHIYHFSQNSLIEVMKRNGFNVLDISAYRYGFNAPLFQQIKRTLLFLLFRKDIYTRSTNQAGDSLRLICEKI